MEKLYLGVAREIITPNIGGQLYGYSPDIISTTVEDELTVTSFYFKQGEQEGIMITATVCLINTALSNALLDKISLATNVPKSNIVLSATHTHSGPNTAGEVGWGDIDTKYCEEIFIPKVIESAKRAKQQPVKVRMFAARDKSFVGINRRELEYNSNTVNLGQNDWGCFNPYMTVLSFVDYFDNTVANIIHYGCHGTAAGKNTEITRDWAGWMIDALEEETGGITAFFNGAEGDVGPRLSNGKTMGDITHVRSLGEQAAKDVLNIQKILKEQDEVSFATHQLEVKIPLKPLMQKAEAEKILNMFKDETVNLQGMIRNRAECVLDMYKNGFKQEENFVFYQNLIKLGDFVFAAFPFELFCEIAMRIDACFGDKNILSLSNTNGSEGYFVTEDSICRGGYEVDMHIYGHYQSYEKNADTSLVVSTVNNIKKILEDKV